MGLLDSITQAAGNAKSGLKDSTANVAGHAAQSTAKAEGTAHKAVESGKRLGAKMGGFFEGLSDITERFSFSDEQPVTPETTADDISGVGTGEATSADNDAFHGRIEVAGKKYGITECSYRFHQECDDGNKPTSRTHGGVITFVMPATNDDNVFFYKWMFSKTEVHAGVLTFVVYAQQGKRFIKTVHFKNAYCIHLKDYFNDHDCRLMHSTITLAAEIIQVGTDEVAEFNNEWT